MNGGLCCVRARAAVAACAVTLAMALPGPALCAAPQSKHHRATIGPSLVRLAPGAEQPFKVVMVATRLMAAQPPREVRWSVNDIPGGDAAVGTIDASGLYRAPERVPSPREVHVCAEVPNAANRFLFATVIVGDAPVTYRSVHLWSEPVISEETLRTEHMLDPHGIALGPDGNLLIADQRGNRVLRYTTEGRYLGELGSGPGSEPGQFNAPHGLFVDRSGDVFVSGYYGPTQKFNAEGDFILAFAHGDPPDGPVYFHNMTGDGWGNVYVMVRTKEGYQGARVHGAARRISVMKYNNNGDPITGWSFTAAEHRETTVTVGADGRVYALFDGDREKGVETFVEE